MNFIGIIPSRYDSTRFPGKPLADINGKSMIQRVYEQVSKVLDYVVVATDDVRIESAVKNFGGKVVMTSVNHKSGTDRCVEAVNKITKSTGDIFDVIVNIQGDEPFIEPEQVKMLMQCFKNPDTEIATLISPISDEQDIFDSNKVKVVLNSKREALLFSRSPIPFLRNAQDKQWLQNHTFYKHIGMYAYKYDVLKKISNLTQSSLELAESLEQLRWLENGYTIQTKVTHHESIGIDTPEDLKRITDVG